MTATRHLLVTPALDGPATGGTLYDARLLDALHRSGVEVERVDVGGVPLALGSAAAPAAIWVDSLYMEAVPALTALARERGFGARVGLLAHYLPSLVTQGDEWTARDVTSVEVAALRVADAIVTPSPWLGDVIASTGIPTARPIVVEPGVDALSARARPVAFPHAPLAAVLVGNVVPGKGIAPFLEALAPLLDGARADVRLTIVGALDHDVAHADECRALLRTRPSLAASVRFASALPHAEALAIVSESDVLVSASRMESYGMALAEARALGVPILARRGGNVASHVDPDFGGELVPDACALAAALVRLSRDRVALAERVRRARGTARARSWDAAARDFLEGTRLRP